ncbi:unnamed protein product [Bubo scandiacus]
MAADGPPPTSPGDPLGRARRAERPGPPQRRGTAAQAAPGGSSRRGSCCSRGPVAKPSRGVTQRSASGLTPPSSASRGRERGGQRQGTGCGDAISGGGEATDHLRVIRMVFWPLGFLQRGGDGKAPLYQLLLLGNSYPGLD